MSIADDVLENNVGRVMRGVGGVCEMCMCLARGVVACEKGERIGFELYQSCGNRESVGRVSVFGLWRYGCCWGRSGCGLGSWDRILEGDVVLCLCVCCEYGCFVWQVHVAYIVLGE